MINNVKSRVGNHEPVVVGVNQKKLDVLLVAVAFFLVWKIYWWGFNLISPQDTVVDILALFGVIVIVIPCTAILQLKIRDFLKR